MIRFNHLTQTYEGDNGYKVTAEQKDLWDERHTAYMAIYSEWYYNNWPEKKHDQRRSPASAANN